MPSHRSFSHMLPAGVLLLTTLAVSPAVAADQIATAHGAALERLLAAPGAVKVGAVALDTGMLRGIYQARSYEPLWPAGSRRDRLIAVLSQAGRDGLDSEAYLGPAVEERRQAIADDPRAGELDALLTDAALRYAADLRTGRVTPDESEHQWQHQRPSFDVQAFLRTLGQADDQLGAFADLAPPYPGYQRLREALARLREVERAGGWPQVPAVGKDSIKPGMSDDRIPAVRSRLAATGEFTGTDLTGTTLDNDLAEAVKRFQEKHGLDADGVVGRSTAAAMSVTVQQRIDQVIANMERWRWLPRQLEPTHLMVNIGGQYLQLVKDGEVALQTRVVVGKPTHRTVAFKATVSSVTLNPPWNVPDSIATKEILPELIRNPDYLVENRLRIVGAFPPDSPESEGYGFDWRTYKRFPYQLRQVPGVGNSLGQIKFNMPNGNDIYLHDTPSKGLFSRARRAFSHGCVRVQDPVRLAATLIGREDMGVDRLKERIAGGNTQTVQLSKPVPIYLFYFTAWVDNDGVLQVRDDIYGYDSGIMSQLAKRRQKLAGSVKSQQ